MAKGLSKGLHHFVALETGGTIKLEVQPVLYDDRDSQVFVTGKVLRRIRDLDYTAIPVVVGSRPLYMLPGEKFLGKLNAHAEAIRGVTK